MFWKIFLFEVQNRTRRPAVYLYFAAALIFTIFSFAAGSLPLGEKEHINSPYALSLWCAGITMFMMLVSSSIMGTPLYRDIEYNTKNYYLTYPITKAGYFWGRYLGSFLFMLLIASSVIIGAVIGARLGPAMGITDAKRYGPNEFIYYLQPFLTMALPNLFFTSSLFFGLVALTRNVKVIYSGGIMLFLGYILSVVFLSHTDNDTTTILADPFGLSAARLQAGKVSSLVKNTTLFPVEGTVLLNRLLWTGVGLAVLLFTYFNFSFEKFFGGRRDKPAIGDEESKVKREIVRNVKVSFAGSYNRKTLLNLSRLELMNILRDNYFWIIVFSGLLFLGFVFGMGNGDYGVPDIRRTAMLLEMFTEGFPFFIFFIIVFYTGETLHRDRVTRYALINDSLPPPNWVLNGSKLVALLMMGFGLSLIPMVVGVFIQTVKGFHQYNFSLYFVFVFTILLPNLLQMVLFAYVVHVVINNKFAAHGVAIALWVLVYFLNTTGIFNYNLLAYSYTPGYGITDMDGVGHMLRPIYWFNLYWLLGGGLLVIVSALFYNRGVTSSFKERLQLVRQRFDKKTRLFTALVSLVFLAVGGYIYYNISYLNSYLTQGESETRAVLYEKTLKKYASLPLPKITAIKFNIALFPDEQREEVRALVSVVNKNIQPISEILLGGEELTRYSVKLDGVQVPFTSPLLYDRGMFNWFRPAKDTANYRLYQLGTPIAPGDSAEFEVSSSVFYKGFRNDMYAPDLLRNGIFFNGGLPHLGYDENDEVQSDYVREKNGLPSRRQSEAAQNDAGGTATLKAGKISDLFKLDITVSTSGDQTAIAPGELVKQWRQNGRNYFHYVQNQPGMYAPLGIFSARYANLHERVNPGQPVDIDIYYHPANGANIGRFMAGYKDGLKYFSDTFGPYPFKNIRLAEISIYGPQDVSMATINAYAENNNWNADFTDPDQFDYVYFNTARKLAQQWWNSQVSPSNTAGSLVISEGLPTYSAIVLAEKKYGKDNLRAILQDQVRFYIFIRSRLEGGEHPLIKANEWFEWSGKAGVVMYGLRDLMGEDSLNAALREFKNAYAFKSKPPYAGANDLYRYLQKRTPDSLQYYLTDTWQKVTLYDNKVEDFTAIPTGKNNEYKVTLKITAAKVYIDNKGNDIPAKQMNDYIDIGVFAADTKNKEGRTVVNPLYIKRMKLAYGSHQLTFMVKGKPVRAGIDPLGKLIDRIPADNLKGL